jgi:hypothetical protein
MTDVRISSPVGIKSAAALHTKVALSDHPLQQNAQARERPQGALKSAGLN